MQEQWNERYSKEDFHYGKEPNNFLKEELPKLTPGKILFIGEGEGRNAVYAAKLGWDVDATDFSDEGKRKAEKLAEEFNVKINYEIQDFAEFVAKENTYDVIGIFFIHLDENLREELFEKLIASLKINGKIIFECFEKEQINHNSGGPKNEELLYSFEDVVNEFIELDFEKLSKEKVVMNEAMGHSGRATVIRFIGVK